MYDVPKRKKSKDTTTEKLYTKLDLMSNEYSFRKILEKHLEPKPFPQIKAVVFVPSIAEIDEIRDICKEAFPKALHLAACSKYKDEENQEAYQVFEEDTFFDTFLYVDDIRMQAELEAKKQKEQMPKKISDRIPWAKERSEEYNAQIKKNKAKYRGMEL